MVADTADWASISGQPASAVTVNNNVATTVSNTVGITDTDPNQPHIGVNTLQAESQVTLAQGATSVIVAGVANKIIRVISMELGAQLNSGTFSGRIEDTNGNPVYTFPLAITPFLVVAGNNLALPSGAGLQFHNTSGVATSITFTVNMRYTQV